MHLCQFCLGYRRTFMRERKLTWRAFVRTLLRVSCLLFLSGCWLLPGAAASVQVFVPLSLHSFNNSDRGNVQGNLIRDAAGNLFGTTYQGAPTASGLSSN